MTAKSFIIFHTESLMYGVSNNVSESFNFILAKFVGGKKVNFFPRGSYNFRYNAVVASCNADFRRLSLIYKKIAKYSPGLFTKRYIHKTTENPT